MISNSKVFQEASQEKVKLKEDLLMPVLLKLLFKEAVINKETYYENFLTNEEAYNYYKSMKAKCNEAGIKFPSFR